MQQILWALLATVLALGPLGAAGRPDGAAKLAQESISGECALLNINNISLWFCRDGWSGSHPLTLEGGVLFPRSTAAVVLQDGLVWGGQVQDGDPQELRVGGQTFEIGTAPGRIVSRGVAADRDAADVRIYRIRPDYRSADLRLDAAELFGLSPEEVIDADVDDLRAQYETDWREWPWQWGAPFYDRDGDGAYDPDEDEPSFRSANCLETPETCDANADQIAWFVVNDLDEGATLALYGSKPIGLEVQITLWGYARSDALGDAIFKKYRVIYKGAANTPDDAVIEEMYFSQWADTDVGDSGDDFAGSDTELSLGYAYNAFDNDLHYDFFGLPPPAVGYDFLQGPIVPQDGSEAIFDFKRRSGFSNLPMTSFVPFAAGGGLNDPEFGSYNGTLAWYSMMRGFEPQPDIDNPVPFIDPFTEVETFFPLDGDPVQGTGWNDGELLPPGDRRIVLSSGPFSMALGDTQEVVLALVAGIGADPLSSIDQLKFNDRFAQEAYDNFFAVPSPPAAPLLRADANDGAVILDWGFNAEAVRATEEALPPPFEFEGYNVYQLPSASADLSQARKIATYDVVNGVTAILGDELDSESGLVLKRPLQIGRDSGLRWFSTIRRDALRGGPLVNGQAYHFAVSAYSYNPTPSSFIPSTLESVLQKVTAVPQSPPPGVRRSSDLDDLITVEQVGGRAAVTVEVRVVAPGEVLDAAYSVTFNVEKEDATWNLLRDGEPVLQAQPEIALDGPHLAVDGLEVQVGAAFLETFDFAEVIVDADPDDGDLVLLDGVRWFGDPDATTAFFWGFGTEDLALLSRDLEFRFTGVWNDDMTEIVSGGSMATLGDVHGGFEEELIRLLDEHPFRPADAPAAGPFLQRIPFEVWDVEDPDNPRQLNAAFFDRGADGSVDTGEYHKTYNMFGRDYITIIASDYDPTRIHDLVDENATWVVFFDQEGFSVWSTGDVLRVNYPNLVITDEDEFRFTTRAQSFSTEAARADLDLINVFPNPYYGINAAEISPANHFVTFSHLPQKATIRIYDLAGALVQKLEKDGPEQFLRWELDNHNELPVASGLYIAHIELPDIGGTRVLKLGIVQEEQFLENY